MDFYHSLLHPACPLNMISVRIILIVMYSCVIQFSFIIFQSWADHNLLIFIVYGHLGCLQVLSVRNYPAVNTLVQYLSVRIGSISLVYLSMSKLPGSHGCVCLTLVNSTQQFSKYGGCTKYGHTEGVNFGETIQSITLWTSCFIF